MRGNKGAYYKHGENQLKAVTKHVNPPKKRR